MWVSFGVRTRCLPIFILIMLIVAGGYFFYEKITGQIKPISIKSLDSIDAEKQRSTFENDSNSFLRKERENFFKN